MLRSLYTFHTFSFIGVLKTKLIIITQDLRYIVGFRDDPNFRGAVRPEKILDWVSSRTLETWEMGEYRRIEKGREDAILPGLLKQEEAERKRVEKLSRDCGPEINRRGGKQKVVKVDLEKSLETPRKRGRPRNLENSAAGILDFFRFQAF